MSKRLFFFSALALMSIASCNMCYECTVQTEDFGPVSKNVCGKERTIAGLINELESDTVGNGPWVCEKI